MQRVSLDQGHLPSSGTTPANVAPSAALGGSGNHGGYPCEAIVVLRNNRLHAAIASFLPASVFSIVVLVLARGPSRPYFTGFAIAMLWLAASVQFWLLITSRLELRPDALTAASPFGRQRIAWCDITAITPPRFWTGGRLCISCVSRSWPVLPGTPRMILWPLPGDLARYDAELVIQWWHHYRGHAAPYRIWDRHPTA